LAFPHYARFQVPETQSVFSRAVSARPLQDQTHGELVYRPLQFQKRSQHFIGADDKALSVAMRVNNQNGSPLKIQSCDPAQAKTSFFSDCNNF